MAQKSWFWERGGRADGIGFSGKRERMAKFRFQDLEIWQLSIEIGNELLDIADDLEERKLYRFSDQMRGAALGVSNNISEGSGSDSDVDFAHFLNIAKRFCLKMPIC